MRFAATLCALATTALLCGACSSSGSGGHGSAVAAPRHPSPAIRTTTTHPQHQPTTGAAAGGSDFCATARKVGLGNVRVVDSSNTDAKDLLPGIDRLDAVAPAVIKTDFHRFTQLEHDLLDPGHSGPQVIPDAHTYVALQHIQAYLQHTCGIS